MRHTHAEANSFCLLVGADAFQRELAASLEDCRRSLYAQFMSYEGDDAGFTFSELLIGKAAQGVDVRLMVDGYSDVVINDVYPFVLHRLGATRAEHARTQAMLKRLPLHGVQVKRTAPPGRLIRHMPYRNHKKMVIVDERTAFVGGLNVCDHNFGWHDFMVKIEGPLVRDLVQDYCSTWTGATAAFHQPDRGGDYILNQCAGRPSVMDELVRLVGDAQHSVLVESPYLMGDCIEGALLAAARRGAEVTLIMPLRNNHLAYRLWLPTLLRRLDHPHIAIHGYLGCGGYTHAKLLLVDGTWASFGSCNMFEIEGLTQKELNVFTSDPALVAQLSALAVADLANSVRLVPPRRAFGRITYSAAYRFIRWWTGGLLRQPAWVAVYC